jgi:hypothetical protein
MLCEYMLKETIDRMCSFYNGALWVHCSRNLILVAFRCCCLRNLLRLLGWGQMLLPGSGSFLMTPSKQSLMSKLKLDVIFLVYICDENVFVISTCCGGCQILASSRMVGCSPWYGGCKILAGSRMQPANKQVTVGVAYISVTGIK